jgi:hypothetical protein
MQKMDRLNEYGPSQIKSSVVKNGNPEEHWLAAACLPEYSVALKAPVR